jgi:hypothetical protein
MLAVPPAPVTYLIRLSARILATLMTPVDGRVNGLNFLLAFLSAEATSMLFCRYACDLIGS